MKFTCSSRQDDWLKNGNGVFKIVQQIPDCPEGKNRIFGELLGHEISRRGSGFQCW
jgi:hypothetical protein